MTGHDYCVGGLSVFWLLTFALWCWRELSWFQHCQKLIEEFSDEHRRTSEAWVAFTTSMIGSLQRLPADEGDGGGNRFDCGAPVTEHCQASDVNRIHYGMCLACWHAGKRIQQK